MPAVTDAVSNGGGVRAPDDRARAAALARADGSGVPSEHMPLRIAMIVPEMRVGGMEVMVLGLSKELRAMGHQVTIVCTESAGALEARVRDEGLTLDVVPARGVRTLFWPRHLASYLQHGKFDIVHSHSGVSTKAVRAARLAGVRGVVNTLHGFDAPFGVQDLVITVLTAVQTQINVGCSADCEAFYRRWLPWRGDRIAMVRNGIDIDAFVATRSTASLRAELGIAPDALVLGTVARLDPVKNQVLLIDAMTHLDPRWELVLVGDGPLRATLEERAASLGIGDRVHFAGHQRAGAQLYQSFDVFALSSLSEAMPLTILEAFAARTPVVAPQVGGIPSLLDDGRLGVLFTPGDAEALAAAAMACVTNRGTAAERTAAAFARVHESHSLRTMATEYASLYRRALSKR